MSTTDTSLSPKTLNALSDLLSKHRAGLRDDLERLLNKFGGTTAGSLGGFVNNPGGVLGGDLKEQRKELEKLIRAYGKNKNALSAHERYILKSAKEQKKVIDQKIAADKDNTKAQIDNTLATEDNTDANEDNTKNLRRAAEGAKDFAKGLINGTVAIKGFAALVDEIRLSYKLGFKWDPVSDALKGIMMGMNSTDMMHFQAAFRRTSGAMTGGINEFNKTVAENQREMLQYTGSMKAAAFAMGNMYELSHSMGLSLGDVAGTADDLFTQFKKMNTATSLTIDQFNDLSKSLLDDNNVRSKLLTLQGKQRSVYVQSLLKQHDMLQAQGMTYEAAQRLVKYIEGNSNKDPLERMKQGAQLLNVARMLGFSPERANRVMLLNNKRDKTVDETNEFKDLMVDFNKRMHAQMAAGGDINGIKQGEIIVRRVMAATGLDVGAFDEASLQQSAVRDPMAIAIQQKEIQQRQEDWLQKIYKEAVIISDYLQAWGTSAIGIMAGGALLAAMSGRGGAIDSLLTRLLGGGGPGGGPGGGGPGAGRWAKIKDLFATGVGKAGASFGIMSVGHLGAGLIDPETMDPENQAAGSMAKSGLQWGANGAALGMLFGPYGAAIGAAAGALFGVGKALYDSSNDFTKEAAKIVMANSSMNTAEQARLVAEREEAKERLALAQASGDMTAANKKTVEELTKKINGLNEQLSIEQQKTQLSLISSLGPAGQALLKGTIDSASELRERASGMDMIAGQAGIKNVNSVQNWINAAYAQASKQGATGDADTMNKLTRFSAAVANGKDMDMPKELQRFFNPAGADALASIQRAGGSQYQSIIGGMDAKSISSLVTDSITQSEALDKKIADLEKQRADLANTPTMFGDFGMGNLSEALQIDRQITEAKAMKENQQKMAQGLEDALTGNRSLHMNLSDDSVNSLVSGLAKVLGKKPPGQSNAAVTQ